MSNFPRGHSGLGLVLLRLTLSGLLVAVAQENLLHGDASALSVVAIVLALFLILGLFTILAASMGAVLTLTLSLLVRNPTAATSAVLISLCAATALLGGGAYSLDARLFGPRRVVWPIP